MTSFVPLQEEPIYPQANWMSQLPQEIKEKPINQITIPGTHDSGAYAFASGFHSYPGWWQLGSIGTQLPGVRSIIADWTFCQSRTIYQQLMSGVRCLDLRITLSENEFYLAHSFCTIKLDEALNDVARFLEENEEEVVLLNCRASWITRLRMNADAIDALFRKIEQQFGPLLCKRTEDQQFNQSMTHQAMVERDERLLVLYGRHNNPKSRDFDFVWDATRIRGVWQNTNNLMSRIGHIRQRLLNIETKNDSFQQIAWTLTPQKDQIQNDVKWRLLTPWSEHDSTFKMAKTINGYLKELIGDYPEQFKKVSIVTLDHPSDQNISDVIRVNYL